jgi:hypothetical protein
MIQFLKRLGVATSMLLRRVLPTFPGALFAAYWTGRLRLELES